MLRWEIHTDSTPEQERTSAKLVDSIEARNGRRSIDTRCDHADHKRIVYPSIFEELGTIIKDKIAFEELEMTRKMNWEFSISELTFQSIVARPAKDIQWPVFSTYRLGSSRYKKHVQDSSRIHD